MKIVVRGDEGVVSSACLSNTNTSTKLVINTKKRCRVAHALGYSTKDSEEFNVQIDSILVLVEDVNCDSATVIIVPESGDDYLWFNNCTRYLVVEENKSTVIWIPNKTEMWAVLASYTTGE